MVDCLSANPPYSVTFGLVFGFLILATLWASAAGGLLIGGFLSGLFSGALLVTISQFLAFILAMLTSDIPLSSIGCFILGVSIGLISPFGSHITTYITTFNAVVIAYILTLISSEFEAKPSVCFLK